MTTELSLLAWAVVLGLVHAFSTGLLTLVQHGLGYAMSPRDENRPLTGVAPRLVRAFANYMQTFPFFAAAILTAHVTGRHDWMTLTGAQLYFWARLAYVPIYLAGIPVARTLAFTVSVVGIVLILLALT